VIGTFNAAMGKTLGKKKKKIHMGSNFCIKKRSF
jgi:hypothetical protein